MAGPAKVNIPGQKQKLRARGTKRASEALLKRLNKQLQDLMDDPYVALPTLDYKPKGGLFRKDPVAATLKQCERVITKKNDRAWLGKRMKRRGGDAVATALAGSFHAAHDEQRGLVAVFNHPIYPSASFSRRGHGRPLMLVSIQQHVNPILRLLAWEEHAKAGWFFFSWKGEMVCTGRQAKVPEAWLEERLAGLPLKLSESEGVHRSKSMGRDDTGGHLTLRFHDGPAVELAGSDITGCEDSLPQSIALHMLPPRLPAILDVEFNWTPEGWPEDMPLPAEAQEKVEEVLEIWLGLGVADERVMHVLRKTACANIGEGILIGQRWWPAAAREEALASLSGSDLERQALACVIDACEGRLEVGDDGAEIPESEVIRLGDDGLHAILGALWPDHGHTILAEMFDIEGEAADEIHARQLKRKQGFGAFLRKLTEAAEEKQLLSRFPWKDGRMSGLCGRLDAMVRKAVSEGVNSTITMAKKGENPGEKALGWSWITVHEKTESEGWKFDSDARDKGGDWVISTQAVWDAAQAIASADKRDKKLTQAYVDAVSTFADASGATDFKKP